MKLRGVVVRGLILGAVAGLVWVASRRTEDAPPKLVDWERVRRIAHSISQTGEAIQLQPSKAELARRYRVLVEQSSEAIGRYAGQAPTIDPSAISVFDRAEWIDANVAGFRELFEPLERVNHRNLENGSVAARVFGGLNQALLSNQLGLLMGFLGRVVLGQYDLAVLGREPVVGGRLYFVEPNISAVQERLGLDADDFRMWISLHESTHAYEFEAYPWLRDHMNGLLARYFDSMRNDLYGEGGDGRALVRLARRISSNVMSSRHALELVMSEDQRETFLKIQALMSLLEGYSNHVMDAVGRSLLRSYSAVRHRLDHRVQRRTFSEKLFARLTGLDVKLEQYLLGERFVGEVVRQRGIGFMNRVWRSAAHLPTMAEIRKPAQWIARVEIIE